MPLSRAQTTMDVPGGPASTRLWINNDRMLIQPSKCTWNELNEHSLNELPAPSHPQIGRLEHARIGNFEGCAHSVSKGGKENPVRTAPMGSCRNGR